VFAAAFNPESTASTAPFSADQHSFTLVHAWSVFTHLVQSQTPHYLREAARLLRPEGVLHSTWFLFDKRAYPMLQDSSNALYVNDVDPSAAVIYDREWLRSTVREAGLVLVDARPPAIRGFQWVLVFAPVQSRREEVELPEDRAPFGRAQAPSMPANASRIGLEAGAG
jgi:SAM-dependent methyltransferase